MSNLIKTAIMKKKEFRFEFFLNEGSSIVRFGSYSSYVDACSYAVNRVVIAADWNGVLVSEVRSHSYFDVMKFSLSSYVVE